MKLVCEHSVSSGIDLGICLLEHYSTHYLMFATHLSLHDMIRCIIYDWHA